VGEGCVGASLGFWTGEVVVDIVWGCAGAFVPGLEKGHMFGKMCMGCQISLAWWWEVVI
jgi:hypothetical protein